MGSDAKRRLLAALILVATGFCIYANTLQSPFVFDDRPSILENPFIEALWPLSRSFGAPPGAGSSGRPLVSFSLALNYAIGGREVLGYHLFNIGTLVLGALALLGVCRRALLRSDCAESALGLALTIALLWMVHPLQTDTLNHVVYRNGSMMGLFYLLALYCALRSFEQDASKAWTAGCWISAAAAMASKEVAVSLPLVVLAFDRQFGARGFVAALKARTTLYAGLATTWVLLAWCVLTGDRGDSVGYGHTDVIDGMDYLRTQMVSISSYLKLSGLGAPFAFDYHGTEVVRDWSEVSFETALLALGLGASIWAFVRGKIGGLLGLCFFALLAPTSSVIPLAGELIAEHRMYLPLAPLIALAVLWIHQRLGSSWRALPWLAPVTVLCVAGLLSWKTVERNRDYSSRVALWQDTVAKRPNNPRAWNHLGTALKDGGDLAGAEAAFLRALELDPQHGKASFNHGNLLFERGDTAGALERYASAARNNPEDENIRFNYAFSLAANGRARESLVQYRAALEIKPNWERPIMLLSWTLSTSADDGLRDGISALSLARQLNELSGFRLPRHLDTLAAALAESGNFAEAEEVARSAVKAASSLGNSRLASEIERRRLLYHAGRPFRTE